MAKRANIKKKAAGRGGRERHGGTAPAKAKRQAKAAKRPQQPARPASKPRSSASPPADKATKQGTLVSQTGRAKTAREGSVKYLTNARIGKNDEFYTILSDIERELRH